MHGIVDISRAQIELTEIEGQIEHLQGRATAIRSFLDMADYYKGSANGRKRRQTRAPVKHPARKTQRTSTARKARSTIRTGGRKSAASAAAVQRTPGRRSGKGGGWGHRLKRAPDATQTKVATAVIKNFSPGDLLTANDAAPKVSHLFDVSKGTSVAHQLSSYLMREAKTDNGILEPVSRGKYRVRNDAESRLQVE